MSNNERTYTFEARDYVAVLCMPDAHRWRVTVDPDPDHSNLPTTWFVVGLADVWAREGCKGVFPSLKAAIADIDTDPCRENRESVAERLHGEGFSLIHATDGRGNRTEVA